MSEGKEKCRILREIRKTIAEENDIPLVTEECQFEGECSGTCPRCESEARYLEEQLEKRRAIGKKVAVSAMALGLMVSSSGCNMIRDKISDLFTGLISSKSTVVGEDSDPGDQIVADQKI